MIHNVTSKTKISWTSQMQKKFLNELATKLEIAKPSDWGNVTARRVNELGGGTLIKRYKGSLFRCLQSVYKDIKWNREWFPNLHRFPKAHFKVMENRKKFMDDLAVTLNIKKPRDWGNITLKQIHELGGGPLLNNYYRGSLFACLQSVHRDTIWKREWFSNIPDSSSTWKTFDNHKKFMERVGMEYDVKQPKDWGKVSLRSIHKLGGGSLILKHYNGSILSCLESVYQGTEWKRTWFMFPAMYWNSMENCRKYLDDVKSMLAIKEPMEWGKVTVRQIHALGGGTLLTLYKGSLFRCLQSVYKEIEWKREWFPHVPRFAKSHWNIRENCVKFFDEVASNLQTDDWRKITLASITQKGGRGLVNKYGGTLLSTLRAVYPINSWDHISNKASSSEMHLQVLVEKTFPGETVFVKHKHHQIMFESQ